MTEKKTLKPIRVNGFFQGEIYLKEQIDDLVAELQKTRKRLDVERQGQTFGSPLKLFRNGQINMIDWLLNELGAKKDE